ncbi:MAG TPA: hypothetical protein DD636_04850 [Anaerolineaceae bacterium]|jgi:RNA polymerase sigma-70 factor (ECF subfamily)|nr:hypothetical protein [Anaerolineaceae bacterium]
MENIFKAARLNASTSEDADLAKVVHSDESAFAEIYSRYSLRIYRYVYNRVGDMAGAEDLTSQVFLDALEHIDNYRPNGSFAAWLFTIARRRSVDYFRHSHPNQSLEDDQVSINPDVLEQIIKKEERTRLIKIIQSLDNDDQELLRLRYAAGLSFLDIAAVLNRTPASVKMAFYRLIEKIKQIMEDSND